MSHVRPVYLLLALSLHFAAAFQLQLHSGAPTAESDRESGERPAKRAKMEEAESREVEVEFPIEVQRGGGEVLRFLVGKMATVRSVKEEVEREWGTPCVRQSIYSVLSEQPLHEELTVREIIVQIRSSSSLEGLETTREKSALKLMLMVLNADALERIPEMNLRIPEGYLGERPPVEEFLKTRHGDRRDGEFRPWNPTKNEFHTSGMAWMAAGTDPTATDYSRVRDWMVVCTGLFGTRCRPVQVQVSVLFESSEGWPRPDHWQVVMSVRLFSFFVEGKIAHVPVARSSLLHGVPQQNP